MKNTYLVTLKIETDADGLVSIKVIKLTEVIGEDPDGSQE